MRSTFFLCIAFSFLLAACAPRLLPPTARLDSQTARMTPFEYGKACFDNGKYHTAASLFERVEKDSVHSGMATAYLGLCDWFSGYPAKTVTRWQAPTKDVPAEAHHTLRSLGTALTLLAARLQARRAFAEARTGVFPPQVPNRIYIATPEDAFSSSVLRSNPPLRAFRVNLTRTLMNAGFDVVPRATAKTYESESGFQNNAFTPQELMHIARLLGATVLVRSTISAGGDDTQTLRTVITTMNLETPDAHRKNFALAISQTRTQRAEARAALADTLSRQNLCSRALSYRTWQSQLDMLIAKRDTIADAITAANADRRLAEAASLYSRYAKVEKAIAKKHHTLKRTERTAAALDIRFYLLKEQELITKAQQLREQGNTLRRRLYELDAHAAALRQAAQALLPKRQDASFTILPSKLGSWSSHAADSIASMLRAPAGQVMLLPAPMHETMPPSSLQTLDRMLAAWDDGEYAEAWAIGTANNLETLLPPLPPDDFDALQMASLPPRAIARYFVKHSEEAFDITPRTQTR